MPAGVHRLTTAALFKNVIYVGALSALLNIDFSILKDLVSEQFKGKEKLITPNIHALEMGHQYASTHFECPLGIHLKAGEQTPKHIQEFDQILMDGNTQPLWARFMRAPLSLPGTP